MTLAELDRFIESQKRVRRNQERTQATFDYLLADLMGRSFARVYNSSNKMPSINEVYPALFTEDEIKQSKEEMDRQRFMAGLQQFANTHNDNLGGGLPK